MIFFKNLCFFIVRSIFIILGIIFICCLPKLFLGVSQNSSTTPSVKNTSVLQFNIDQYIDSIASVISSLFTPTKITYKVNSAFQSPDRDLFPYLLDSYVHTLTIMIGAFLVAILLSTTLTILTFYFSKRVQSLIIKGLHVLEALPDLFFVLCVQLIVIWIYKNTNLLVTKPFSTMPFYFSFELLKWILPGRRDLHV
ncbi:hypothetical protein [Bacillus gaemokensis]|uniref:hypothetical protein n=1 Tax=Bacillus gaemokensis TaxID=574375 RepID=UPI00068E8104|nr:hypothetical protein [Bacillus gaemokensis]KYG32527.1 hypothetical protein AZF08_10465 [Bacillus gaemokensis]